eukprot:4984449-Prorocentrum_lima.AAC.1
MTSSLVGSEMCIRDREWMGRRPVMEARMATMPMPSAVMPPQELFINRFGCLLYTSDAADDM